MLTTLAYLHRFGTDTTRDIWSDDGSAVIEWPHHLIKVVWVGEDTLVLITL